MTATPENPPIRRALVSVSDKTGLAELGRALAARGIEILSTGGSAKALSEAGVAVTEVSEHTGFPEIMDGRVKTLHPKIHGGILARRDLESHREALAAQEIAPIDLVVVNLYPFGRTVASGADFATCVENIDIGGPAMLRAAAKNHDWVTVVVDPADYPTLLDELERNAGATAPALRRRLAGKVYAHTAAYDSAIANWLAAQQGEALPESLLISGRRLQSLRYGENPHQKAAFYVALSGPVAPRPGVASATQVQGKALSYNNLNDTDAAFELAAEFDGPAIAIIKHANPCGVAEAASLHEAYRRALACDPVSAYGGDRRRQPAAGRGDGDGDRRALRRGGDRPRRRRGRASRLRAQEEPAPAAHRGPAGPGGGRPDDQGAVGRLPGAGPGRRPDRRGRPRGREPSARRARRSWPT